jgi:hypothetical protein
VDANGYYSLQIFREKWTPFASDEKTKGTPDEYRQARQDKSRSTRRHAAPSHGVAAEAAHVR